MNTVLIVEDNEFNMKLARFILNRAGYTLLEADDAEAGLKLAREHRPQVVLMDIHLPGMDGIAAAQALRADPTNRGMKLIAVTATVMKGDRERIVAGGFDGFLGKPFRKEELLDAVRAALQA